MSDQNRADKNSFIKGRSPILDVVVVGGGPGGLSAALVLGRSRRNVTVVDDGQPRNAVTLQSHGFLSRDGIHPLVLRKAAREQVVRYDGVTVVDDRVVHAEKTDRCFTSVTQNGQTLYSKKIIFATGVKDRLPEIPGIQEVYGRSVFLCPYCDGWERRDQPLALFGNGEELFHFVKMIFHWSRDLILFTNGPSTLTAEEKQELSMRNIRLVESPITKLESTDGQLERVVLDQGESIDRRGGFILDTRERQACIIPEQLGVPRNKRGGYQTDDHGQTRIDGLFIIGDAKNGFSSLISAASEGYEIGIMINQELIETAWR
ncbi:NAD(P)/FAD-dependent oxidoreductase [Desmospora profundinema]|uniref:Thioredoxin reductase n=1 Tax=Desmospora profundinema TaxID=1571184 RepID=A0ABU1IS72_9BACL|nr:NAD(P)/FAD-dependent oxidoreductase [Desmospora profundinema]MDR6227595.1 thioredoxin reductase [Desmospora profundinema]